MDSRVCFSSENITVQNAIELLEMAIDGHETRTAIYNLAIIALQEKQQRDNQKPLTLDELRDMPNQPVWIADLSIPKCSRWHLITEDAQLGMVAIDAQCRKLHDHLTGCFYNLDNPNDAYGRTWLAYRAKPLSESSPCE